MLETAIIVIIVIMIIAHFVYWLYEQYNPACASLSEYFIGAKSKSSNKSSKSSNDTSLKKSREGFWGELPGRDYHEGSYDDPQNLEGKLGHETVTGDFMSKKEAKEAIYNVLMGASNLSSTTEPTEQRTADQIYTFHDEMEGVKASISGRKHGRVWTPSEFLNMIERDGYKSDDPLTNEWDKKMLYPPNPYDTSNVRI
jgi:hypothetical protein